MLLSYALSCAESTSIGVNFPHEKSSGRRDEDILGNILRGTQGRAHCSVHPRETRLAHSTVLRRRVMVLLGCRLQMTLFARAVRECVACFCVCGGGRESVTGISCCAQERAWRPVQIADNYGAGVGGARRGP